MIWLFTGLNKEYRIEGIYRLFTLIEKNEQRLVLIVCVKLSPMRTILFSISYTIVLLNFLAINTFALVVILHKVKIVQTNCMILRLVQEMPHL